MNNNIIRFYMLANRLKEIPRTGWLEIEIAKDEVESVSEHIFGTLILAIAIDSEYKLDIDMYKVLKTLTLHELEEILMPDFTVRSNITKEEKVKKGMKCVEEVTKGLYKQEEIVKLLDEYNHRSTKEAMFSHLVDKIEADFQAKVYDLQKVMLYDKAKEDLDYYGERSKEIELKSKTASDFWIEYDRPKYQDNDIFKTLIEDIKNIDDKYYEEIKRIKEENIC